MPIITLTTDYGTRDAYVGALKGVILSVAPQAQIVDVTHEIEPYSVLHGALVLKQVWHYFPPGTIHLAVVDPGVGTSRRIVIGSFGGRYLIAPDNGLLTFVARCEVSGGTYSLANPKYFRPDVSPTFHGRDVMAPVAGHLANGVSILAFGPLCDQVAELPMSTPSISPDAIRGQVLYADRFGTLVTDIAGTLLDAGKTPPHVWRAWVDAEALGEVRSTFADVAPGEALALIGSAGFLEIAVNRGRAVDRFGVSARIELRRGR